jgi:hypothetical protein
MEHLLEIMARVFWEIVAAIPDILANVLPVKLSKVNAAVRDASTESKSGIVNI